jgi:hypothetical protein
MAKTREAFQATPRDRQQMHEIAGSSDLPDLVSVDLDGEDPNAYEVVVVDDTPENDKGRPTKWDGKSATEEPALQGVHPKVQKRIDRLRAETETERRAREASERREAAAVERARQLEEDVADLRRRLDTGSTALATSMKEQREQRVADARRRLSQAHADGDSDAIAEATADMTTASAELAQISARTPAPRPAGEPQREQPRQEQQRTQAPTLAPNVAAWISHNDRWFNKDQAKTRFALSLHEAVVQRGIRPDSAEYTAELDKGMAAMYPDHQPYRSASVDDDEEPSRRERTDPRRTDVVERGSREDSSRQPARRQVELTASEVAIANRLRVPLAKYAAEKLRREQNGKGGA